MNRSGTITLFLLIFIPICALILGLMYYPTAKVGAQSGYPETVRVFYLHDNKVMCVTYDGVSNMGSWYGAGISCVLVSPHN